jgi:hypothetical protein
MLEVARVLGETYEFQAHLSKVLSNLELAISCYMYILKRVLSKEQFIFKLNKSNVKYHNMGHCILQYLLFQNELPMSLPQNPQEGSQTLSSSRPLDKDI